MLWLMVLWVYMTEVQGTGESKYVCTRPALVIQRLAVCKILVETVWYHKLEIFINIVYLFIGINNDAGPSIDLTTETIFFLVGAETQIPQVPYTQLQLFPYEKLVTTIAIETKVLYCVWTVLDYFLVSDVMCKGLKIRNMYLEQGCPTFSSRGHIYSMQYLWGCNQQFKLNLCAVSPVVFH